MSAYKKRITGTLLCTASVIAITVGSAATSASQAQNVAQSAAATPTEEVVVTGSRGQGRAVMDSPTPIDSVSAADLTDTGSPGVLHALQNAIPSLELPFRSGGGTNFVILGGGLRTLNPDQTLVLVNGLRRHSTPMINVGNQLYSGSAPVDLDLIPVSAIDHVEVLRDGAAAQYGSDAVAGVINIILKDTPGGYVNASYGQNFDRADGELYQAMGTYGIELGSQGSLNLSVAYKDQAQSNRAEPIPSTQQIYPLINGQPDPREATANRLVTVNYGQMPVHGIDLADNGHYNFGSVDVYASGTASFRESYIPYTFQFPNAVNTLPQVYPEGFISLWRLKETDFQQGIGARGTVASWDWDLSSTAGLDIARENSSHNLNPSLGPSSPTDFYLGTLSSGQWVTSLDLTRNFSLDRFGSVQASFGAQDRAELYKISPGDPASYAVGTYVIPAGQPFAGQHPTPGAVQTPGFQPSNSGTWKRNIGAAYAELDFKPTDQLFFGAAMRYESYDDSSGDSVVWKVNGRYDVTDWLAFRGSAGTGFHAASLAEQHYSNSASQFATNGSGTILNTVLVSSSSPTGVALGATPLVPETSTNYSLGSTIKLPYDINATVDAYQILLDNRIFQSGLLSGTAVNNILIANNVPPNQSVSYFTNGVNTRTTGVDVVITDNVDLDDLGMFRLSLAYSNNGTKITYVKPTPSALSSLGSSYVLLDAATRGYLEQTIPRNKVTFTTNWSLGDFAVNVRESYISNFRVINNTPTLTRQFGEMFTTDLEVDYHLTDTWTFAAGANNLLNEYPSRNGVATPNLGTNFYPQQSPIGFTGGSWYVRVQEAL